MLLCTHGLATTTMSNFLGIRYLEEHTSDSSVHKGDALQIGTDHVNTKKGFDVLTSPDDVTCRPGTPEKSRAGTGTWTSTRAVIRAHKRTR